MRTARRNGMRWRKTRTRLEPLACPRGQGGRAASNRGALAESPEPRPERHQPLTSQVPRSRLLDGRCASINTRPHDPRRSAVRRPGSSVGRALH